MDISEPQYEYERGRGWVATVEKSRTCIREHEGKRYRVTIIERAPRTTMERSCHTSNPEEVGWWETWQNNKNEIVPEGFGFAIEYPVSSHYKYTVITEAL